MNSTGLQWTPQEAASVNEFLSSPLGRKWLQVLFIRKPGIDVSTADRAAMTGAFSAGYEQCFKEISMTRISMTEEPSTAKPIDMTRD